MEYYTLIKRKSESPIGKNTDELHQQNMMSELKKSVTKRTCCVTALLPSSNTD